MALTPLEILFNQRNEANTAFREVYVSGSNLVVATDPTGILYGTTIVPSASYALNGGTLLETGSTYPITSSWAITSSYAQNLNINNDYNINDLTASNALIKKDLWVKGSVYASVFSASNIYITSSQLVVTDNIITLNAMSPHLKYAGIEMYDSGSGTLSSLLWDSEKNYFFISSSDANYAKQVILGPDLEASLIPGFIPLISSSNSITSSIIYQTGSLIIVNGDVSGSVFSSSISDGVGFYGTASYVLNNGIPSGGQQGYILSKKTENNFDTEWVENPNLIFTASNFSRPDALIPPTASAITCSSNYSYWHLHTNNDLNVYLTSSVEQTSFTIRLVSSGSIPNKVTITPYESVQWVGTAGFGSSSIEQLGSISMMSGQEILLTFVYYNLTSSLYPEKKFAGIVTDLNTPGLETKTVVSSLYVIGEGEIGINGDQLNNPDAFIGTICGGGTGPDAAGPTSKTFWGWVPVKVEGFGRKYFPLYE